MPAALPGGRRRRRRLCGTRQLQATAAADAPRGGPRNSASQVSSGPEWAETSHASCTENQERAGMALRGRQRTTTAAGDRGPREHGGSGRAPRRPLERRFLSLITAGVGRNEFACFCGEMRGRGARRKRPADARAGRESETARLGWRGKRAGGKRAISARVIKRVLSTPPTQQNTRRRTTDATKTKPIKSADMEVGIRSGPGIAQKRRPAEKAPGTDAAGGPRAAESGGETREGR